VSETAEVEQRSGRLCKPLPWMRRKCASTSPGTPAAFKRSRDSELSFCRMATPCHGLTLVHLSAQRKRVLWTTHSQFSA